MPVFEEKERTDPSRKRRGELTYNFYDRVAGQPFGAVRDIVNLWTASLPASRIPGMLSRLRARSDREFDSAIAEIIMYTALSRLGFQVEIEPALEGVRTTPDFLLRDGAGQRLAYVEVTTINPSGEQVTRNNREAPVFTAINRVNIPSDLRLVYDLESFGERSVGMRPIQRDVESWARENAERARRQEHVERVFAFEDWRIRLTLLAGFTETPGSQKICMYGDVNGRFVGPLEDLGGLGVALNEKVRRYGNLDLPFLIAVFDRTDRFGFPADEWHGNVADALFGLDSYKLSLVGGKVIGSEITQSTYGWIGKPDTPRNPLASAVLVFPHAQVWRLGDPARDPVLVHHPGAARPLPVDMLPFRRLEMDGRKERLIPGITMSKILGLPSPWPPEE